MMFYQQNQPVFLYLRTRTGLVTLVTAMESMNLSSGLFMTVARTCWCFPSPKFPTHYCCRFAKETFIFWVTSVNGKKTVMPYTYGTELGRWKGWKERKKEQNFLSVSTRLLSETERSKGRSLLLPPLPYCGYITFPQRISFTWARALAQKNFPSAAGTAAPLLDNFCTVGYCYINIMSPSWGGGSSWKIRRSKKGGCVNFVV